MSLYFFYSLGFSFVATTATFLDLLLDEGRMYDDYEDDIGVTFSLPFFGFLVMPFWYFLCALIYPILLVVLIFVRTFTCFFTSRK